MTNVNTDIMIKCWVGCQKFPREKRYWNDYEWKPEKISSVRLSIFCHRVISILNVKGLLVITSSEKVFGQPVNIQNKSFYKYIQETYKNIV